MKKLYILAVMVVGTLLLASCGVQNSQAYYDYKSKLIAAEMDGTYTIRAYGRARNAVDAYVQARKQAVSDVLFEGVQAASGNLSDLRPLLLDKNAKARYEDYFNRFFADGGEFEKYASMKERRLMSSKYARTNAQSVAQVTVCVDRAALKQKLIDDGILK